MRIIYLLYLIQIIFISCNQVKQADTIFFNGKVYTVDSTFSIAEAFAVKEGKILAAGTSEDILTYDAKEKIDLKGKPVYPGFIDAHCHFLGYALDLQKIWLTGTGSFSEIVDSLKTNSNKKFMGWIFGRGWDQNDWEIKEYPDNTELDKLFPDVPVLLLRIDGHAALVNQVALDKAGISVETKIDGGIIEQKNGKLTGILIDNAVDLITTIIPDPSNDFKRTALLEAQKNCFAVGLTTVSDAGINSGGQPVANNLLFDEMHKSGELKMRIYSMALADDSTMDYYFRNGKVKTDRLNVCSFKMYSDGALGSRGAALLEEYSDMHGHFGLHIHPKEKLEEIAKRISENGWQMNTHCIGDSAHRMMLKIYAGALKGKNDLRWRIEHAQNINHGDLHYYGDYSVIPSVQPTHATSDMYWAEQRLGKERMKGAYAYKELMLQNNLIANGSDFPVESINPLFGFYAAVVRKDQKGFPPEGFQMQSALTREQALRAMTIWAAYSNFEEKEKGSIEKGKFADFVILEEDIMTASPEKLWQMKVLQTFVNGEKVFEKK